MNSTCEQPSENVNGLSVRYTLNQVLSNEPVRPRRIDPSISRDLETICLKCLEKEPGQRYSSAAALATDLRQFLNGEPIVARLGEDRS